MATSTATEIGSDFIEFCKNYDMEAILSATSAMAVNYVSDNMPKDSIPYEISRNLHGIKALYDLLADSWEKVNL